MPRPVVDANGKLDPELVRQRALEESMKVDVKLDRQGRKWVRDFPILVEMPEGTPVQSPDGTVETRYIMRYANGRAEYILEADNDGKAIGRLIHGVMDAEMPEVDEDGFIITEEDRSNARQAAKAELQHADDSGSGLSLSGQS